METNKNIYMLSDNIINNKFDNNNLLILLIWLTLVMQILKKIIQIKYR